MESEPARWLTRDQQHQLHSLHKPSLQRQGHVWVEGRGAVLVDADGREYLDALSGLWNVILGHGREELARAAAGQMQRLAYASGYAGSTNPWSVQLAEQLGQLCYPGINRFFFTSGGAEANEAAFKTARYYWKLQGKPEKVHIISRRWAYHGTTLGAMSATGIPGYWDWFGPPVSEFSHIESPYPYRFRFRPRGPEDRRTPGQAAADLLEEEILRLGADRVAAFVGEPVQGAAGVIVPPEDYWPRIRQICDRHQVLLIADEVITGFGRTGRWFALEHYGVEPDIVTFAKGITSGYFPLGGMGVNDQIAEAIDQGEGRWMHAYTYSGHPVGCAVALETLRILQSEGLLERARELGQRILSGLRTLESHPHVGEVRGLGLMAAVELVADKSTGEEFPSEQAVGQRVHQATQRLGMFTRLRGDVYNVAPCYVTSWQQADRMVEILGRAIEEVLGG